MGTWTAYAQYRDNTGHNVQVTAHNRAEVLARVQALHPGVVAVKNVKAYTAAPTKGHDNVKPRFAPLPTVDGKSYTWDELAHRIGGDITVGAIQSRYGIAKRLYGDVQFQHINGPLKRRIPERNRIQYMTYRTAVAIDDAVAHMYAYLKPNDDLTAFSAFMDRNQ